MWPDRCILDLLGVELPILQAPMAGSTDAAIAVEVARAGGLGALACAMWSPEQVRNQVRIFSPLWAGQAAAIRRLIGAAALTRELAEGTAKVLAGLCGAAGP